MKARLLGVHSVTKRLADGSDRVYYYAWRGGPRINKEPGTREFLAEYVRLTRTKPDPQRAGSMAELISAYMASPWFTNLRTKTRFEYERYITLIEGEFCDFPLAALAELGARKEFLEWRDKMADRPRTADMVMTILHRIFQFGLDREIIARNPIANFENLHHGSRRDSVWTDAQIEAFKATASEPMRRALMLALWTGQRQGDLLKVTWAAYDGQRLSLKQSKTGAYVRFKIYPELKAVLDATPRTAVTILTNNRGLPWSSGFKASWAAAKAKAGVKGVTFHDLRGTFCTAAYRAGSAFKEIAEVSGHSEAQAEAIIRKHYLGGNGAIERLESRTRL